MMNSSELKRLMQPTLEQLATVWKGLIYCPAPSVFIAFIIPIAFPPWRRFENALLS